MTNHTSELTKRKQALKKMREMIIAHEEAFMEALKSDLGKSSFEAYTSEIAVLLNEIDYIGKHLHKWMKPKRSRHLKLGYMEKVEVTREPFGRVLVISPWNYPLQLALMPVINALAAGNTCVIKPSEFAPETSRCLEEFIATAFEPEQCTVVRGDADVAKQLIGGDVDFIFFTGSGSIGRKVYQQATDQLTPVLLELGGRNPCIIEASGFSKDHIREIVWSKFLNAGQTCIAPNALYVHESIYPEVLDELRVAILEFFGENPEMSEDYGRMVHENHFDQVESYLQEGSIQHGGVGSRDELYIAPTIVTDIGADSRLLKEEIFGPILPVIPYREIEELLDSDEIQKDALVAYMFSTSKENMEVFRRHVKSTVSINQVIHHITNPEVPFGGIGNSGIGAYHGVFGFNALTYERTFYRAYYYIRTKKKYPPYAKGDLNLVRKIRNWML